jgi:TolA-binding protein
MTRGWAALLAALSFTAPFQCGKSPDPNLRHEDTAGDALWALAEKFDQEHNDAAAKETLQYLLEKYPSSRHAPAAREKLGIK